MALRIPRHLYDEIVAHALEKPDVEVCGMVACRDGEAVAVHRGMNIDESGGSFLINPLQQIELLQRFEEEGLEFGALYHSHPHIQAVPSGIDRRFARSWPGLMWIIVGLRSAKWSKWKRDKNDDRVDEAELEPEQEPLEVDVWAWYIENDRVTTAELTVVDWTVAISPGYEFHAH